MQELHIGQTVHVSVPGMQPTSGTITYVGLAIVSVRTDEGDTINVFKDFVKPAEQVVGVK